MRQRLTAAGSCRAGTREAWRYCSGRAPHCLTHRAQPAVAHALLQLVDAVPLEWYARVCCCCGPSTPERRARAHNMAGRAVSSVKFLQLVSVLTFTITNGLKRAFIVAVAMLYFAMPVTLVNTLGVIFAMGGGIM